MEAAHSPRKELGTLGQALRTNEWIWRALQPTQSQMLHTRQSTPPQLQKLVWKLKGSLRWKHQAGESGPIFCMSGLSKKVNGTDAICE